MISIPYRVGDRIYSTTRLEMAPPGSVVCDWNTEGRNPWVRQDDGRWTCEARGDRGVSTDGFGESGSFKMFSYPEGFAAPAADYVETVRQFKWRFRDVSLMNARRSGIEFDPVVRGLSRLGLDLNEFPLGPGVVICNRDDLNTLPTGTVVQRGNPEFPTLMGVHRKTGGAAWERVLGNVHMDDYAPVEVISIPNVDSPPEWVTEQAAGAEGERALAEFKALAWKVGFALKQRHSWCSTFENTMTTLGIDESCLAAAVTGAFTVGSTVTQAEASGLPEGTVLRYQREGVDVYYYRTDEATNSSRTKRLFGWRADGGMGHTATTMQVVAHPEVGALFLAVSPEVLASAPVGTCLGTGPNQTEHYVKCLDGRWTSRRRGSDVIPDTGRHDNDAFGGYRVISVPDFTFPYLPEEI